MDAECKKLGRQTPEETNTSVGRVAVQNTFLTAEDCFPGFQRLSSPRVMGSRPGAIWPNGFS